MPEPRSLLSRPVGWQGLHKVAIVGAGTLKGKELKETLEDRNFPSTEVLLLDDEDSIGQLDVVRDEATFIQNVTRDSFDDVDLAFFASSEDFTLKNWKQAQKSGAAIVDLSYALEVERTLRVRSPWIDRELKGTSESPVTAAAVDLETTAVVVAHPAATMLALLVLRLQKVGKIRTASATVFDPVSEQGKRGMDELHQQTLNLLSFQSMPKDVYDMQVAFNMLSRYGDDAKASLEQVTDRIARHFTHITRGKAPLPALQVLQAPTFHGHAISLYFEPEVKTTAQDLQAAISGDHLNVVSQDSGEDGPSNVTAAGQEDVLVALRADRNSGANGDRGFWLWATADNLKIAAITALECALGLAAARPSGKIQ
ncbi:MAG TPA: Asd/ArgC dimerization domain-containing protein [Terriglobales bacterium]|nr:Asd/ArgC dimerization domain-containing protein [Terriglobales bacterium]